jgi:hypothetical protein
MGHDQIALARSKTASDQVAPPIPAVIAQGVPRNDSADLARALV